MYKLISIIKTFIFSALVLCLSTPLYLLTFALLALKTIYTLVFNTFQIGVKSIAFLCNRIDNAIESLTVYLFNQKYIFLLALPAKILHLAANIIFIPVFTISKALDRLPSVIEYPHLLYFIHNIARDFFHNNDQKKFVESYLTFRSVNDIETFLDTKIIDDNSIDEDVDINEQFLILGLDAQSADQKEVNKAYKKLSLKNHPDKGGDQETQKKINEAKEYLDNFFSSNTESSNETTESRDLNLNQYFLYAMSLLIKIDQFNIFLEKNFRSMLSILQIHKQRFNTNSL
ncbi:MAG: DnaJ domain-containing protein, partial [Gammaproteobacteria bacterium]|nr:DnaJ domain-containing protein [Gammaproteobacteria bacterium]